jgi:hypothetical protein
VIIWNTFYLCYILCLIFFMIALLLTDKYIRSGSNVALALIGFFSWLSIHSHNYTIVALLVLPIYVLFIGGYKAITKSLCLAGVLGTILLLFLTEYLAFAGMKATTFFNQGLLSSFPDSTLITFWFCGAFFSPLYFLFCGHFNFPAGAVIFGSLLLGFCIVVIWRMGTPLERKLGLWALLLNALPFLMVSLGRYGFAFEYAFTARYVFFTSVGSLLLLGIMWTILHRRISAIYVRRIISGVIITIMIGGQIFSMPFYQKGYLMLSKMALDYYQAPERFDKDAMVLFNPLHPVGPSNIYAIRSYLKNKSKM